ncbi:hypothetical protein Taro_009471 [Colocasia esculenta]|uniref:RNase H type-1 domain-containing protein n=1 Tax=Colocasia esculenta TaxID=4460 RepID=A0A843U093_COLES|nr:hypothetical protein [Colocasia esculenta]
MLWRAITSESLWGAFFKAKHLYNSHHVDAKFQLVAAGDRRLWLEASRLIAANHRVMVAGLDSQATSDPSGYQMSIARRYCPPSALRLAIANPGGEDSNAAGGGILWNESGDIIFAFTARYYDVLSSLEAEALALRDGVSLCRARGIREFYIKSDSLVLVQVVKEQAAVDRQLIAVDRPACQNSGLTGTVCICRQPSCICRQIHTVQQDDVLSAAICRQVDRSIFDVLYYKSPACIKHEYLDNSFLSRLSVNV